jgi:hypothetical protein
MLKENPAHVIRELSQNEHLANSALYEGPLLLGAARRLENLGDRAIFRDRLKTGHLKLPHSDEYANLGEVVRSVVDAVLQS